MCWDDRVSERKPYPSDLSDERWALIEPVITAWKAAHPSVSGHQGAYEMREIVNAILYQGRTGCQWDYLPHDLPPHERGELLLRQVARRRHRPDHPRPAALAGPGEAAAIRPTRAWWCSTPRACTRPPGCPPTTTGKDAAKKVPGPQARPGRGRAGPGHRGGGAGRVRARQRRRHRPAGPGRRRRPARCRRPWSTRASRTRSSTTAPTLGIDVEIVERNPADKGFVPQPKRWVVEQTYGILMLHRRLVRDYEHRPASLRVAGVLGDERRDGPPADRRLHPVLAVA